MQTLEKGASPCLGTPGYLACLVFSFLAAVLAPGWKVAIALSLTLMLALLFYRNGLAPLRARQLWLFVAFILASSTLLLGSDGWNVAGVVLSEEGLVLGLQMGCRAITILVAVAGFGACVSIGELTGLLEHGGMRGLGFALGVAVNMLPIVQETTHTTYQALRLRGGFRRCRLQALRLLLVTIVVNTLRHADDIVSAAQARAFSDHAAKMPPILWRRSDIALAALLLIAGGLLMI